MSQIPPEKKQLDGFAWFDYVRPLSKEDIFVWRGKKKGTEMKATPNRKKKKPTSTMLPPSDSPTSSMLPPSDSPTAPAHD
jgi:hypothetical protein